MQSRPEGRLSDTCRNASRTSCGGCGKRNRDSKCGAVHVRAGRGATWRGTGGGAAPCCAMPVSRVDMHHRVVGWRGVGLPPTHNPKHTHPHNHKHSNLAGEKTTA